MTLPSKPSDLRSKLAQLILPRIGSNLDPVRTVDQDADRIARLLEDCPLGGIILFNGRKDETARTLDRLQSLCDVPLLVTADIERGLGQQVLGHPVLPHAMAFDALGDDAVARVEDFARLTAEGARSVGIHVSYGPVADVNIDPLNPVIATRSFGTDPVRVAQLVAAYVRAATEAGMLTCAKHFPGHGNTHEDSHHALPTVHGDRASLDSVELPPFQAAVDAGVPLLMTAHVRYPGLDPSNLPATLSQAILTDLLRGELGFDGAVISDSLLMEGVTSQAESEGDLAVSALNAGVDLLLDVADPSGTLDALERAVEQGAVAEARVDEAVERMWKLKTFAAQAPAGRPAAEIDADIARLATQVAVGAVQCESENPRPCFAANKPLCALFFKPFQTHLDPPRQPLAAELESRFSSVEYHEIGPSSSASDLEAAREAAESADQLLLAMVVKPAAWHHFGLLPEQNQLVEALQKRPGTVLACLGSPVGLERFAASVKFCTFSDVPASQAALAQAILDGAPAA
ncbi:MAG: glycoside hydrolase family 3 protein [Planctomycetota bacterium]